MIEAPSAPPGNEETKQFALAALLKFVTVCAVLAALSAQVGVITSICLMLFALSLAAKRGTLALVMVAAVLLAADMRNQWSPDEANLGYLIVLLLIGLLCIFYRQRQLPMSHPVA